jgi:hypothetical protein
MIYDLSVFFCLSVVAFFLFVCGEEETASSSSLVFLKDAMGKTSTMMMMRERGNA